MYICLKSIYTLKIVHRYNEGYKHNPELSTAAMFIGYCLEFAKFLYAKNKALINAFSYICLFPTLSASVETSAQKNMAKIQFNCELTIMNYDLFYKTY